MNRDEYLLTALECAGRLNVSERTLRRLAATGEIPGCKVGACWRFHWPTVMDAITADNGGQVGQTSISQVAESPKRG